MVKLSNGHSFEYMAASGALAFDGTGWPWEHPLKWVGLLDESVFTTVIKTLTLKPRRSSLPWYNPFGCIRIMSGGTLNAVGLTNPGAQWWCDEIGPKIDSKRAPVMGSILGEPNELAQMAKMLNDFDMVGLEINASCPNTGDDILVNTDRIIQSCEAVGKISRFPLVLKLSCDHDIIRIVEGVENIVESFSINSVPWNTAYPRAKSPLFSLGGGGVSGKIAQTFTWKLVAELAKNTTVPIIGTSVWDYEDIEKLRVIGASAISFGAIFLRYPWRPTAYVRRDKSE